VKAMIGFSLALLSVGIGLTLAGVILKVREQAEHR